MWLKSVLNRVIDFLDLEDGWYDGEAKAFSPFVVPVAVEIINFIYSPELEEPSTFPTFEGGLQFEWDRLIIEILPDLTVNIYTDDYDDDKEVSFDFEYLPSRNQLLEELHFLDIPKKN